jgi:Transposase DDE domain
LRVTDPLTTGLSALPQEAAAFASFQAAWRFYANPRTTLPALIEPLQQVARRWRPQAPAATWALVIHDWSPLKYPAHHSKADQTRLSHGADWGYELTTLLLVDGGTGDPVAPVELRLRTARAVHSTRTPAPKRAAFRIDEVLPSMQAVAPLGLGPVVHVIDREADSLDHYRRWQTAGQSFLVRADDARTARWHGESLPLAGIARRLRRRGAFRRSRAVRYRGQEAVQQVAETAVVLDRPAWRHRRRGGRAVHERVPGPPLALRLVVSRVCDARGQTLAVWYLLTNVPADVPAATVALWYYWRWRVESFFKLLKGAGQQVEHWQQATGLAIAKRLLVAAMACVVVWRLERQTAPPAEGVRALLVRLSGRLVKRGRGYTAPALLAGLWVLVAALEALEQHSVAELRRMKQSILSGWDTG